MGELDQLALCFPWGIFKIVQFLLRICSLNICVIYLVCNYNCKVIVFENHTF